jgi:hypothetical protein
VSFGARVFLSSSAKSCAAAAAGVLVALSAVGCPDTQGQLDDFVERWERTHPAGNDAAPEDASSCVPPAPGELTGQFVFALSAVIAPPTPIVFLAEVSSVDDPNGSALTLELQPLSAADRTTPVGSAISVGPHPIAPDGTYQAVLPPLVVTGEANPITGSEIAAEVTLDARICGVSDFYCGTVSGRVTSPLVIPLAESTFAMERVSGALPAEPLIDCNRARAAPL